ncbi:MAG: sigma-70 family RNA polymerase sigma factor [Rhodospirillales bacterium]|nr:sigma-70 family RNA polymerase sigma factor [Rhodospirillales bacterium]MDE1883349.1 sigma-70 family RNA polymerase sigma factor [Rhodospirillales bacterium]MDE2458523.1 sigma-70 family RNA polymerase sigma factor [Rhodospirillales bacterium]
MADAAAPGQAELTALYGHWIKRMALLMKARMPWADLDDMLQWGAIGMMEASQRFNPEHGVPFQAFAARRIKGAMIDGLRREGTRRRSQAIFDQDAVDIAVHDNGDGPEDPLALLTRVDNRTLLVEALRALPQLEYRVLALHFYEELNNREIASVLDISEGYASRLRKRALEALALHINAAQRGEFVS